MIDWNTTNVEEFELRIEGEAIQESGNHIIFPVHVYHQDGTSAFLKSVPIRLEFYNDLKKTGDWKDSLMKIIKQRVRDDLFERIKLRSVPVEDKIGLINLDKQTLVETAKTQR